MNVQRDAFSRIAAFYDRLVDEHGHHYRACDYGRAESQRKKFEIMAAAVPLGGKTVLDVGCGFADFADFLNERYEDVSYTGVDISPRMTEQARALHPGLDIKCLNILEENPGTHDVVMANGIFYLLGADAWAIMQRTIARMFDLCREAVIFNTLSTVAYQREADEFYANPARTLEYCQTLTPRVVLRHDYLPHDFTVLMHKIRE